MDLIGDRTVGDLLQEQAERRGNSPFLVFEDRFGEVKSYSYAEFAGWVDRAATAFVNLGIGKGDKVTVHLANSPEFLFCWFALGRIGAVMVPSNTANTEDELAHVINFSDSKVVVTERSYRSIIENMLPECPNVQHLVTARGRENDPGTLMFGDLLAQADVAGSAFPHVNSGDEMLMLFTSGTTSRPKGVLLTHAVVLRCGERMSKHLALRPDDRCLTALPLFHVNAQATTVMSALTVGATCIILESYSASRYWQQIRRHQATCTSLVPVLLRTIAAQERAPTDRDHALRAVAYAINVTDREKEAFEERFGVELINYYGLTEAMMVLTMAPIHGKKRWPSVGLPAFDREVSIVDEHGEEVPRGTIGEIVTRGVVGRTIMKGYYKDPEATAAAIRDGWLYTGDQGYMDDLGYVYFVDRKKDIIKRAAENVSASEVERVLLEHPDVLEAAVIGVSDPVYDEAVKAYILPVAGGNLTEDMIWEYCKGKLAKFKVPSFIEFVDVFPRTSVGKVEKKILRQWNEAGQNLGRKV